MKKPDLVKAIADSTDVTQADVDKVLGKLTDVTTAALLRGDEVSLPGLGKFESVHQEARDVKTFGVEKHVPAKNVPKFRVAKPLKDALAG